jgi:hypothetical protein
MWVAVFLGKHSFLKKAISITASIILISVFVLITTEKTYKATGTRIFTAFSGWQLANNAMHVLRQQNIDTTEIIDKKVKHLIAYSKAFLDTTKDDIPDYTSSWYMWFYKSPLKQYMAQYEGRSKYYFRTWTALGPLYNKFGKNIILQNPGSYLRYFVLPNSKDYILPRMEIYKNYFEHVDTVGTIAKQFYGYKQDKIPSKKQVVYDIVFTPWRVLFPTINIILLGLIAWYIVKKKYLKQSKIFNYTLIGYYGLYVANFLFIILLAPTVFRYHIFIITLAYPIILLLIQQLTPGNAHSKNLIAAGE